MAIIDKKIQVADYTGKDIAGLPDKPSEAGVSASTLKARFDSLTKNLTVVNFNGLIDELVAITASSSVGASTFDGIAGTNVQTLLENLKIYTDGEFSTRDLEITAVENGITALNNALGAFKFTELTDTPSSYVGESGKVLTVNPTENGIIFANTVAGIVPSEDVSVEDAGAYYTNTRVEGVLQEIGLALSTISLNFIGLTDTPSTYVGQAGKFPAVNALETGLEFVEVSGSASGIDITDTGAYYASENVEGALQEVGASVANKVDKVAGKGLSEADFTTIEKSKLATVEENAKDDQSASEVPIADSGFFYTNTNVEGALQEIGNDLITGDDDAVGIPPLVNADTLDGKTWLDEVGTKVYTEQNVVTSGETVTASVNKLDIDSEAHKLLGAGDDVHGLLSLLTKVNAGLDIIQVADWNTSLSGGLHLLYDNGDALNAPEGAKFIGLQVNYSTEVMQIAVRTNTSTARYFIRHSQVGIWYAWRLMTVT